MGLACPIDGTAMCASARHGWLLACPRCSLEASTLVPDITSGSRSGGIAEDVRETGLNALRSENARRLLEAILQAGGRGRLLDVGSGPGFFLAAARSLGFDAIGIEPDEAMVLRCSRAGLEVRHGFFPDALPPGAVFDVIVLNDVLEHIPDLEGVFAAFAERLSDGGLLVLNSPDRNGIIYRVASVLDRLGIGAPFQRMWQFGLPSPHVWYFTRQQMRALCEARGFTFAANVDLLTLSRDGLYDRIAYVRKQGTLFNMVVFALVWTLIPLLRVLPRDIAAIIMRKGVAR